jgi:hypothetical protein
MATFSSNSIKRTKKKACQHQSVFHLLKNIYDWGLYLLYKNELTTFRHHQIYYQIVIN